MALVGQTLWQGLHLIQEEEQRILIANFALNVGLKVAPKVVLTLGTVMNLSSSISMSSSKAS